jgi:hypothetical protein
MIASGHPHTPSNTRCTRRPQVRSCERPLVNANVRQTDTPTMMNAPEI